MQRSILFLTVAVIGLIPNLGTAQNAPGAGASERRVASRIAPDYPVLAKRMHMHGVVKIEAVVRANGSVKSTRVLGGNPVLVDAAIEALRKWKFEPAHGETTELVQLAFEAQ